MSAPPQISSSSINSSSSSCRAAHGPHDAPRRERQLGGNPSQDPCLLHPIEEELGAGFTVGLLVPVEAPLGEAGHALR